MATRTTLLRGCCAVSVTPPVWVWNLMRQLASDAAKRSRISREKIRRAARNLATSSNRSLCAAKKKDRRGANRFTSRPVDRARSTYSIVLARVKAISWAAVDPASLM
jgi:hypothetical protein